MKKVLFVLIAACLMSCNSKKKEETTPTPSEEIMDVESTDSILGKVVVYEGLLPCANCEGIKTVLKIYQGDGTIESHKFELTSVYKGKSEKKFIEKGSYDTERGLENDPDGTIYVLNFETPNSTQTFYGYYSASPDKVFLLNNKREKIKSKLDYSLTKNE